jgi:hypothetical protein
MPKRDSSVLSPPINEVQKRYSWNAEDHWKNNRYHVLSNEEEPQTSEINTNNNTDDTTQNNSGEKVPPIFLHDSKNHQEVIKDIESMVTKNFSTENKNKYLKINLRSSEDYRKLTKYYNDNSIAYHSFQDSKSKPLSVVLKNVPVSLTNEEISEELKKQNLPIISVTRLLSKEKQPLTTCAVLLTASEVANNIFKTKHICKAIITVEVRRKPNNIPQCYRCQEYGHTKNYCKATQKCVKCAGSHSHVECKILPTDNPTCANCKGNHPASYRGCPHHKALLQQRSNLQNQHQPRNNQSNAPSTSNNFGFKTYAQATSQNQQSNSNSTSFIDNIFHLIKQIITPLIPQIKQFLLNLLPSLINV